MGHGLGRHGLSLLLALAVLGSCSPSGTSGPAAAGSSELDADTDSDTDADADADADTDSDADADSGSTADTAGPTCVPTGLGLSPSAIPPASGSTLEITLRWSFCVDLTTRTLDGLVHLIAAEPDRSAAYCVIEQRLVAAVETDVPENGYGQPEADVAFDLQLGSPVKVSTSHCVDLFGGLDARPDEAFAFDLHEGDGGELWRQLDSEYGPYWQIWWSTVANPSGGTALMEEVAPEMWLVDLDDAHDWVVP